ncbi:galectin-1 [Xenopus laevis]|uniref:Galectin n=2 Tax=Xenopus laevis TaxID=8355 RepID=A0A974D7I7_XENLA|nr:galectin-1 [Xenopus laevis]OCT85545.1 hypothetical protein XELAEV_18023714mg [Xenopus laevis]
MDMQPNAVIHKLNLTKGYTIEVRGIIDHDANRFAIELGKDADNVIIHFNPRFDYSVDKNIIICNSKHNNVWGSEQKEPAFPFQKGSETMIAFEFQNDIRVKLPDGRQFTFPLRVPEDVIQFLALYSFHIRSISIHFSAL